MKLQKILAVIIAVSVVFVGCSSKTENTNTSSGEHNHSSHNHASDK